MSARPVVTLYVTRDCRLCEDAERLLRRLAREMAFRLERVDIGRRTGKGTAGSPEAGQRHL